jgi:hypothetical protein
VKDGAQKAIPEPPLLSVGGWELYHGGIEWRMEETKRITDYDWAVYGDLVLLVSPGEILQANSKPSVPQRDNDQFISIVSIPQVYAVISGSEFSKTMFYEPRIIHSRQCTALHSTSHGTAKRRIKCRPRWSPSKLIAKAELFS